MAQLVLAGAGALIGGAMGFPMIGYFVGSALGSLLFPQQIKVKSVGPRMTDLSVHASTYGLAIPIIYGHVRVAGNVIFADDIQEHEHTSSETTSSGKKGPETTTESTTYTYTCSFAVGLCEGEIDAVTRIWADGKLVWSRRTEDVINSPLTDDAGGMARLRIYYGTETQEPDPMIEAILAASSPVFEAVAHRGLAYVVFEDLALGDFGNRIPNLTFEVVRGVRAFPDDHYIGIDPDDPDGPDSIRPTVSYTYNSRQNGFTHPDPLQSHLAYQVSGSDRSIVEFNFIENTATRLFTTNHSTEGAAAFRIVDSTSYEAKDYICTWSCGFQIFQRATVYCLTTQSIVWTGSLPVSGRGYTQAGIGWAEPINIDIAPIFYLDNQRPAVNAMAYDETLGLRFIMRYSRMDLGDTSATTGGFNAFCRLWGSDLVVFGNAYDPGPETYLYCYRVVGGGLEFVQRIETPSVWWGSSNSWLMDIDSHGQRLFVQKSRLIYWLSYDEERQGESPEVYLTLNPFIDLSLHSTSTTGIRAMFYHESMDWLVINQYPGRIYIFNGNYENSLIDSRLTRAVIGPNGTAHSVIVNFTYVPGVSQWAYAIVAGNMFARVWLERHGTLTGMSLALVVEDICLRCGLEAADFDVSDLTPEIVNGYTISQQSTGRTIIEDLMACYFFDGILSGNQIKFLLRGRDPVAVLTYEDLAAHEAGNERPTELEMTRTSELDLPREVDFTYVAYETDYQQDMKYARNLAARGQDVQNIEIPIVFEHAEALLRVEAMLSIAWMERTKFKFAIAPRWIWLDPGDTITVLDRRGLYHGIMITRMTASLPGLPMEIEGSSQYAGTYTLPTDRNANAMGATTDNPVALPLSMTVYEAFTGPALNDGQATQPGYYVAMTPIQASLNWRGGVLFASSDGGVSFAPVTTSLTAAPMGNATTALGDADTEIWDDGDGVEVQLYAGALSSATNDLAILNGANAALLGDEIIQYRDVTPLGARRYRLTRLLRGRRGTEWAAATHAAGDRFVALSSSWIRWVPYSTDRISTTTLVRTASVGSGRTSLSNGLTLDGANLEPYRPCHVEGARDGTGNLTITWDRRTRIGGGWLPYVDVQLGETTEAYEVDIMSGSAVVRTLAVTTASASYSAAQQTADFGSPQASIDVVVYQLSSMVGRGYPAEATV